MYLPVGSLHVFDAAARHLSFKAAANELNLSPSAVSHAIAKLEREIGALLFDRDGRQLALTLDGQTLHGPIEEAFGLIRAGITAVSSRQAQVLRLHAAPSFAALWLMPRLNSFLDQNPGMEVQIAADTDYSRFSSDDFDADIIYGRRQQDGLVVHPLGREVVRPMCTPELAALIADVPDMLQFTLIRSTLKAATWEEWFRANGVADRPLTGMRFDRSFMAIAAAADGLGICLDSTRLAARDLASGRLVMPLQGLTSDLSETDHYLVYPKRNAKRPIVVAFTRWLLDQMTSDEP